MHDGANPLQLAAYFNHPSCLKVLLAAGAAVNSEMAGAVTALYLACQMGFLEAVRVLTSHGADCTKVSSNG